ncbi:hypothetical protein PHYSODRAFT_288434 [Phytophthora sojae]|uniref:RxLR effector protein n=2 Tax=Phytophthora sojae TaxID=67593 RepID=G5A456_PHYSP|nr:hypothetical protein PHYSODRAFT_288434 [Phytophthora sojae]AEK80987.1 Avh231 [Phytophthora sojae]AEK80988.1 Avh231 [Phytophthora sojae]AEK80989.1 Avh231 [Phytophthora sojae]EGZ09502.1 hypothetical protein PHYSODRAFT_288434 [Phytophthora sojae]|eukprot:XP_009534363.1 hypothetical protein PHYSODRAFT_288434 [Phytophthora sojae]
MQRITLLAAITFCAVINAAEAAVHTQEGLNSKIPTPDSESTRLLRAHEVADNGKDAGLPADDEERGANAGWVSRLADIDRKTWKMRKLDMKLAEKTWISIGWDPVEIFKYFNRFNAWANIENSKRTIQWFRFTKAYRAKKGVGSFPDYEIYHLLRSKVPEEKLALALESLKQIPDVKNLAETVQNYQLKLWVDRKETRTSIAKLLGIPHSPTMVTERGPKDEILSHFSNILLGSEKKLTRSTSIR